ncbi:alpha-(1,3)-fucosyltransferase 7-like [Asterias amurensis]|uniref:alpha-(1,3)-fucosyltransferase 7-like n=1 Tax=Asterias amurensis TaxID=7602 RepID=UPI003AB53F0E
MATAKQIVCGVFSVGLIIQGYYWTTLPSVYKSVNMTNNHKVAHDPPPSRLFHSKVLSTNTKLLTSNQTTTAKNISPNSSASEGQCHYRVQLIGSRGFRRLNAKNIRCANHCNLELSFADGKKVLAGMDAVVFILKSNLKGVAAPANPTQAWIYHSRENPRNAGRGFTLPVHATWTYHRGSEISARYGFYEPGVPMTNQTKSPEEWVEGKSKLVAWIASNCYSTYWPRTAFVHELKKLIPIDMYGRCGNLKCDKKRKCSVDLLHQYKFYLSLENTECGDYITEKFWGKPLQQGAVPIVNGAPRKVYEELAPPNSFIYVGDYKNMKELADYLKLLDSKPELYAHYLEWRYKGRSIAVPNPRWTPSAFCKVIPIIEKVKRGELKRVPVRNSQFAKSCRASNRGQPVSNFGVKWVPW